VLTAADRLREGPEAAALEERRVPVEHDADGLKALLLHPGKQAIEVEAAAPHGAADGPHLLGRAVDREDADVLHG